MNIEKLVRWVLSLINRNQIMSQVTGYFTVQVDGVVTTHTISGMEYSSFWFKQQKVLDVLNETSRWGLMQFAAPNEPNPFTGPPTGNVSYSYLVDFSNGGNSRGSNEWNGVPSDAAAYLGGKLNSAFA